jgi:hypothetical protein
MRFLTCKLSKHHGIYDMVFCDAGTEETCLRMLAPDGVIVVFDHVPDGAWVYKSNLYLRIYMLLLPMFDVPTSVVSMLSPKMLPKFDHPLVYDGQSCLYQLHWMHEFECVRTLVGGSRVNMMADALRAQEGAAWYGDYDVHFIRDAS